MDWWIRQRKLQVVPGCVISYLGLLHHLLCPHNGTCSTCCASFSSHINGHALRGYIMSSFHSWCEWRQMWLNELPYRVSTYNMGSIVCVSLSLPLLKFELYYNHALTTEKDPYSELNVWTKTTWDALKSGLCRDAIFNQRYLTRFSKEEILVSDFCIEVGLCLGVFVRRFCCISVRGCFIPQVL